MKGAFIISTFLALKDWDEIPLSPCFSRLHEPNPFILSSCAKFSNPITHNLAVLTAPTLLGSTQFFNVPLDLGGPKLDTVPRCDAR